MFDNSLLKQLSSLFESGKLASSGRKKKRKQLPTAPLPSKEYPPELAKKETEAGAASALAVGKAEGKKLAPNDFASMYDDDIVVTKYIPVGSLEAEEGEVVEAASAPSSSSISSSFAAATEKTVKGIFDKKESSPNKGDFPIFNKCYNLLFI